MKVGSRQPTNWDIGPWRCVERPDDAGRATGMNRSQIEITGFAKTGGPLTKRITVAADGSLHSDGSACVMSVAGPAAPVRHARRIRRVHRSSWSQRSHRSRCSAR